MLGPLNVKLDEFSVSSQNGFLPDSLPLKRLSDLYYTSWETIIEQLPVLIRIKQLRRHVDELDVLSTSHLVSGKEWQRAYLILSFFTHAYIWESGSPAQRLPSAISIPFLEVAAHVGLPATATYAAFNLWNFTSSTPESLTNLEKLSALHTFSGTKDEEWFYLVSVAIEAKGAKIIPSMLRAMDAVRAEDSQAVIEELNAFAARIVEIGGILERMYEHCDPTIFYNEIRPFLAGSKNMALAGLPRGVFYDEGVDAEGNEKGIWRKYSGGSNAQSSLIQFFDIVLGVSHFSTKGSKSSFLLEMRIYMPGGHRSFLCHMESASNIRAYAEITPIREVTEAYNLAVKRLTEFRDIHIQIVTRYIVIPSKAKAKADGEVANPGLNLAVASKDASVKQLSGTGGTQLIPFLQQSRNETREAALD